MCGGGEIKSPCNSYSAKLGHQMMHGKAIWKSGIGEIAKASRDIVSWTPHEGYYSVPYEMPVAMAIVLMYFGL